MTDYAGLIRALADAGVEYILVGGVAAIVHGAARLTRDIDVVYSRSPENIERLVRALAPHSPYLRGAPRGLPFRWEAATIARGLNFALTTSLGDIDLLGEITGGGSFDQLVSQSHHVAIFRRPVPGLGVAHPDQARRGQAPGSRRAGRTRSNRRRKSPPRLRLMSSRRLPLLSRHPLCRRRPIYPSGRSAHSVGPAHRYADLHRLPAHCGVAGSTFRTARRIAW